MKTNGFDMNMVGVFINVSLDEFGGRGGGWKMSGQK